MPVVPQVCWAPACGAAQACPPASSLSSVTWPSLTAEPLLPGEQLLLENEVGSTVPHQPLTQGLHSSEDGSKSPGPQRQEVQEGHPPRVLRTAPTASRPAPPLHSHSRSTASTCTSSAVLSRGPVPVSHGGGPLRPSCLS